MAKTPHNIKVGMKVQAESKVGVRPGKVTGIIEGNRGDFIEVDHGEAGKQRYRPSKLTKA